MGCVSSTPSSQEDDAPVKKEKVQDSPVKRTANQPQGTADKLNHSGSSSKVAGVTTEHSPAPKKAPSPVRGTKISYLMLGLYLCDVDLNPGHALKLFGNVCFLCPVCEMHPSSFEVFDFSEIGTFVSNSRSSVRRTLQGLRSQPGQQAPGLRVQGVPNDSCSSMHLHC